MIAVSIPGEAVAFARTRMSNSGNRFTPTKQAAYMAVVRQYVSLAMRKTSTGALDGPLRMTVHATYVIPASWPAKKRDVFWKTTKPDADNLAKLVKDACNRVAYRDDAQVAELIARKSYGQEASLSIQIEPLVASKSKHAEAA